MIPTFSPQGDGNRDIRVGTIVVDGVDPYLFPARGRKLNVSLYDEWKDTQAPLIPTFSPQGDGNIALRRFAFSWRCFVDPYLFPARGRKPPFRVFTGDRGYPKLIPTFSPPGDGNLTFRRSNASTAFSCVDPYLFPARGRKLARWT